MKVKINIKSIIFMMLVSIVSLLFINISFAANTGKIIVDTAKLREQPNTDSKVLELTSVGEEVEILEEVEGWYKVKYKKITGYIRNDLIQAENITENKNEISTSNSTQIPENIAQDNTIIETSISEVEDEIVKNGKYKLSENIKLKIIPLISAIELEEVNKEAEVQVIEIINDWVKIKTTDAKEGWARKEKLVSIQESNIDTKPEESNKQQTTQTPDTKPETENVTTTKTMYVNVQIVNVRQKADKTSEVIKKLAINTQVTVLSSENGWAYVDVNGTRGYISESLLSSTKQETSRSATTTRSTTIKNTSDTKKITENKIANETSKATKNTNTTTTNATTSGKGSSVVSYAKQFLGCKYIYGGTTTKGFDCSGFTQYVYKNFGVTLNRTAGAQYSNGTSVTNLQAGDLVMFGKSGINHVGIYIGGNTFIHAANKSRGVTTDTLASGYYKTNYVGARRIF